ncbi:MAG: hypothetical protein WCT41_01215 [Candidatus Paceibacterota bacterium]|jgi:hypothetical protein
MKDNAWHQHPKNPEEMMYGGLLEDKDELEEGDASPNPITKKWEKIPPVHIGARLPQGHKTMFVRPAEVIPTFVTPDVLDSSEGWI